MSTFHLRITEETNNTAIKLNRADVETGRIILSSYSFYFEEYADAQSAIYKATITKIHEIVCDIPFIQASTLNDVRDSGTMIHLPVKSNRLTTNGEHIIKHTIETPNLEILNLEDVLGYFIPVDVYYIDKNGGMQMLKRTDTNHIKFVLNLYFTYADNTM